jgi:hypothetical protein
MSAVNCDIQICGKKKWEREERSLIIFLAKSGQKLGEREREQKITCPAPNETSTTRHQMGRLHTSANGQCIDHTGTGDFSVCESLNQEVGEKRAQLTT